jgi:transcriptional regulator with XRE-family HTH domain
MDNRNDVRDFLLSRRGKVTPEQVGLPAGGGSRRVKGLRRSEVAQLAGVSVEYYTQLERGSVRGASESVLDAVARALLLDEAERTHLFDLARAAGAGEAVRRRPATQRVRPAIQQILDSQPSPAWVMNDRGDFVAANRLGRALNAPLFDDPARPVNVARFRFLNPRAAEFFRDWDPVVGDLDLSYEGLELPSDAGLTLFIFAAEPGSASQEALDLLATWAATLAQQEQVDQRSSERSAVSSAPYRARPTPS